MILTIRDILKLVEDGEITNLNTKLVFELSVAEETIYVPITYWELSEHGLDGWDMYEKCKNRDVESKDSVLILK